ncbi:MAG TPA: thrombospondin type 3 repeat-containing protein [Polyangiaceae bacterium]|jgi:hypothetical protein|nr:thrombospondin type 3 repeat-containing protein [Polyangiaceae bacterium]
MTKAKLSKKTALSLCLFTVACSQGAAAPELDSNRSPIENGTVVLDTQARTIPFVTIEGALLGSGIIYKGKILTAAHVTYGKPDAEVKVYTGNNGSIPIPTKVAIKKVVSHRTHHAQFEIQPNESIAHATKRISTKPYDAMKAEGIDLAVLFPAKEYTSSVKLACDQSPTTARLVSSGRAGTKKLQGVKNYYDFTGLTYETVKVNKVDIPFIKIPALKDSSNVWHYAIPGDSGGPVILSPTAGQDPSVIGVMSRSNYKARNPKDRQTNVIHLNTEECNWINDQGVGKITSPHPRQEIQIVPKTGAPKGKLERWVATLSDGGVDVEPTIDGVSDPIDPLRLKLARPPSELSVAELATFDAAGPTLLFVDNGRIVGGHLVAQDDKTSPALELDASTVGLGDANEEYFDMLAANTTSMTQPYTDLVAMRRDKREAELYLGTATGLQRSSARVVVAGIDADIGSDVIVVDGSDVRVSLSNGTVATDALPAGFGAVRQSALGNYTRTGDDPGSDIAFLSDSHKLSWCAFDDDGQFTDGCNTLTLPSGYDATWITSIDGGHGYADLEVSSDDPLKPVLRFKGGPSGLEAESQALVALVDGRSESGQFVTLAGSEATTPGAPNLDFYVSEPVDDSNTPTGEPLVLQFFDMDFGDNFDAPVEGRDLATCVSLYTSSAPGVMNESLVKQVDELDVDTPNSDENWYTFFDTSDGDSHDPGALNDNGVHWYHASVKLSEGCAAAPALDHGGFNALKVRTTGQLRFASAVTIYGSDSDGEFASFEKGPNTLYDGQFTIPFYVGGVDRPDIPTTTPDFGITLSHADADDTSFDFLGGLLSSNADGARDDIFFELMKGSPLDDEGVEVKRIDGAVDDDLGVPKTIVDNPSADASGDDIVFEKHEATQTVTAGVYSWHWGNVGAENGIVLQPVAGSPINHEYIGAGGKWVSSAPSRPPAVLSKLTDEELAAALPADVGESGFGHLTSYATTDAARAALEEAPDTTRGLLERELLALKLNVNLSEKRGTPVRSAFVLSSRVSIDDLLKNADAIVSGQETDATEEQTLNLLARANAGQITYLTPTPMRMSTTDEDRDGIVDRQDNCPELANADQLDSDADGVGDACLPMPRVWCVEPREGGGGTAVFGYDNPLKDFRIPVGDKNQFIGATATPDVLFRRGGVRQGVAVPFDGDSVSWQVMGNSVLANFDAPRCSDVGAGSLACAAGSSEFHCCTTAADCDAAANFTLYAQSIDLGERVRVVNPDGKPGSVLSLGETSVGAEAQLGSVLAGGSLLVAGRAALFGAVDVSGNIEDRSGRTFNYRKMPLDAPDLSVFARVFGGNGGDAISVDVDQRTTLEPGSYGPTKVSGTLVLTSGTYSFASLEVVEDAHLKIDATHGPVSLQIGASATFAGTVEALPGELLIELTGQGTLRIEDNLAATVYAVDANVEVAKPGVTLHGSFFARHISVAADVTLVHADPLALR